MDMHELTRSLHTQNDSKIVMVVADGLGGLPFESGGLTELEAAQTPRLDVLAQRGVLGLSIPSSLALLPAVVPAIWACSVTTRLSTSLAAAARSDGHWFRAGPERRGRTRQLLHAR